MNQIRLFDPQLAESDIIPLLRNYPKTWMRIFFLIGALYYWDLPFYQIVWILCHLMSGEYFFLHTHKDSTPYTYKVCTKSFLH